MGGFRLATIFGFEIRIDYSWFFLFFLILWSFTAAVFPASVPGHGGGMYLTMGAAATLLLFASLLAHELSHSVVARAKGIPVDGITLFLFGGVAHTTREPETPGDEFQIAGVGPLASLVLALLFWLVWWLGEPLGLAVPVRVVAIYVAVLNLILALFNLLPGFPLDGGRLFRALVWKISGDLTQATRWAARGGKIIAMLIMVWGAYSALRGDLIGGMWLVLIGWFIRNAAVSSYRHHVLRESLSSITARQAMAPLERPAPLESPFRELPGDVVAGAEESIASVMTRMRQEKANRALVEEDGMLIGLITAGELTAWVERARTAVAAERGAEPRATAEVIERHGPRGQREPE